MTLDSTDNRKDYDPDGIVVVFAYDFRVDDADDMVVYEDGVVVVGGYTVSGIGVDEGGDVTFDVAPLDSVEVLSLVREVPLTQETAYPALGPFPASSHEAALDKLTMIDQQQQEEIGRAMVAPIDSSADYTPPDFASGEFWLWDTSTQTIITAALLALDAIRKATDEELLAGDEVGAFADPLQLKKYSNTSVESVDELRGITYTPRDGQVVSISGVEYEWDSASEAVDTTGTIIKVSLIDPGRFLIVDGRVLTPEMFGAIGDGDTNTDDAAAIQAAVDALGNNTLVFDSDKTYNIGTTIDLPNTPFVITSTGGPTGAKIRETEEVFQITLFSATGTGPRKVVKNIEFAGPKVTATKPAGTFGGVGMSAGGNGLFVKNCWFAGMGTGVDLVGTFNNITDCAFEFCNRGIYSEDRPIETVISHITFYKCNYDMRLEPAAASDYSSFSVHATNSIDTHIISFELNNVQNAQFSDISFSPTDATAPGGQRPDFIHLGGESKYNQFSKVKVNSVEVSGNPHPRYGIFLEGNEVDNNQFDLISVIGAQKGIYLSSANGNIFNNIQIMNSTTDGILLASASGNVFKTTQLTGNLIGWNVNASLVYVYESFNANTTDWLMISVTTFYGNNIIGDNSGITATYPISTVGPTGAKVSFRPSAPSGGTWSVGDVIYHTSPVAGGNVGWVRVVGDIWKEFGTIEV